MRTTPRDAKVHHLVEVGLCSPHDALALSRLGDLVTVPGGSSLRTEGAREPWSYCVIGGSVLVSRGADALAVVGPGGWLLGQAPGGPSAGCSLVSAIAGTDVEVLAFRPQDLGEARWAVRSLGAPRERSRS